ncbi:MAG: cation-efflux pump, partial [Eubacteriales bacterium]|nr:cation-efflux pump [Eubacteriales bacterium]
SPKLGMHDFRMVKGEENTNLIFDVVVPFKFELSHSEIKGKIDEALVNDEMIYHTVITFDLGFAEN